MSSGKWNKFYNFKKNFTRADEWDSNITLYMAK